MTQPDESITLNINLSFGGLLAEFIGILATTQALVQEINITTHRMENNAVTSSTFDDLVASVATLTANLTTVSDNLTAQTGVVTDLAAVVARVAADITTLLQSGNLSAAQQAILDQAVIDLNTGAANAATAASEIAANTAAAVADEDTLNTADPVV